MNKGFTNILLIIIGIVMIAILLGFFTSSNLRVW